MSISAALSNAVSGLTAVSRSAELVSANVANAMTEGYGRRELTLGAAVVGGQGAGVTVVGIDRVVNEAALSDRRLSDAALGYHQSRAEFFGEIERTIGTPDAAGSLSAHLSRFDQAVIVAAGDPSSNSLLTSVLNSASELVDKFNVISDKLQAEREVADADIGVMVGQLNRAFEDIDALNKEIRRQAFSGGTTAGLMDQRQVAIDQISELIPIQTIPRDHGQVALLTQNGTTLVDYGPAKFEFSVSPIITPDQSITSGALSGLTLTGSSSVNGAALESILGGALSAAFTLRDRDIPKLQSDLDALALDLSERAATADTNVLTGTPSLFTDQGSEATDTNLEGLASRLNLNQAVNPSEGGEVWRIRDGVVATTPGPASDRTFLNNLSEALSSPHQPTSGSFPNAGSVSSLISDFLSQIGQDKQSSLARQSFQAARSDAFRDLAMEGGVDTDQEMQKLLLIEQNFAANAKVIQAVDEMLQSLLRI